MSLRKEDILMLSHIIIAYLLYYFEVGHKLDLCYIIMKEMMVTNLGQFMGRLLIFGALLTKIFKAFKIRLLGEAEIKISSAILEYTLTCAGGAENLMGSLNAHIPPDDAFENPQDNAIPATEQP
ncbi:hypothetical protein ACSBR2_023346 [Camellia fascicularis]